jgi:putative nucleotidyltransferase with HDIG domain
VLRRASLDHAVVDESLDMHTLLHRQAETLVHGISTGGRMDSGEARDMVSTIASRLEKNAAAMVWLTRIKAADQYTAQHCVNVAIVSMGLAQALEWPRERIEWAGLAGLLHDLGKMKLETTVLNKRGRLSAEEYEQVKHHARLGYEILVEDPGIPSAVAEAVLHHHERPDGLGYPTGKSTHALDPLCALVAVADAYDAITSTRPYRSARSHHEALGVLWKQRGTQFDRALVESLIQFLGWITPGTLVRLSDARAAIVLRASHHHRLWPLVRLIEETGSDARIGEMLDLAEYNEQHPQCRIRVAEVMVDGALKLDLRAALRHQGSDTA